MDFLYIFNVIKDITYDFIRDMSKIMMQSSKVQVSCHKTHKIGNIMLENANTHNLDIASNIKSS